MTQEEIMNMLEKSYNDFLTDIGKVDKCLAIDKEDLNNLQGLPKELISFWKKYGICSYAKGLWWHTNPRDFDEVVEEWLRDTKYWEPKTNRYHVIGRNAYGDLRLWGEKTGDNLEIEPLSGRIIHTHSDEKYILNSESYKVVNAFVAGGYDRSYYDRYNLFDRIHKKLGTLKYNEMYTAVPMPLFSGGITLKNAQKEDLFVQLSLIKQFIGEPEIIDFSKLSLP